MGAGRAEGGRMGQRGNGRGGGGKAEEAWRGETGETCRQRPLKEEGEETAGTRVFLGGRSKCAECKKESWRKVV